jgi:hypothetical protein
LHEGRIVELSDWKPIETANQKQGHILVYDDGECFVAEWDASVSSDGNAWGWADARENGVRLSPSHWMPLPKPPQ